MLHTHTPTRLRYLQLQLPRIYHVQKDADSDQQCCDYSEWAIISSEILMSRKKSNIYYNRGITTKRVTSGGAHLCGLGLEQNSFEETSQRWRAVDDTVSDFDWLGN